MKHHSCPFFIPLLLSVLIVTACCDMGRMRSELANLQARNQADSLLTDDSLALVLTHYFDRHGTPNERMLAHYLLARTYVDQGEAPHALDEFHQAAGLADTTSNDCDYALLSRVHGQTAELLYSMLLPNEMLEELRMAEHFAWKAGDTIMALIVYDRQNFAYDLLGQQDTAMTIARHAYENYMRHGYPSLAASSASTLFFNYVDLKDWKQAERYMEIYEKESGFFFDGEILQGREIHYYYKGKYFIGIAQYDSAEFYFRKELRLAQDSYNREAAYQGLYDLYRHLGVFDSVVKYADSCYQSTTESYRNNTVERLRHMHALYNYNRNKELAENKSREAARARMRLFIYVLLTIVAFLFIAYKMSQWRKRKKEEMLALLLQEQAKQERMQANYEELLRLQAQAKQELDRIQKTAYDTLLEEKEQEINSRQTIIDELEKQLHVRLTVDEEMASTDIYQRFLYYVHHPKEKAKLEEVNSLIAMVEERIPSFYSLLHGGKNISKTDYFICVLIRLHFVQVEISGLTGIASSNLTRKRRQLLRRCFGKEGDAEEFNKMVRSIK